MDTPAPMPEVPAVEKLLQRLVGETQSRPPPVMSPLEPAGLEQMLRSFLAGQQQQQRPPPRQQPVRRDWNGVVCFSCGKSGHAATRCPNFCGRIGGRIASIYAARMAGGENSGGIYYDPTSAGGKRRLIREEGFVSRVSDHVRPRDPGGGGTVPTVLPRRMTNDDVSDTPKLSGGGGPQSVPSTVSAVWVEETMVGDTPGRECPHEDLGMRPQIGTEKMSGGTVSDADTGSPYGRGALPFSGVCREVSSG